MKTNHLQFLPFLLPIFASSALAAPEATVAPPSQPLRLIVNSDRDTIQPDSELTLREALSVINGTLPVAQLSDSEKLQVTPHSEFVVGFNLPLDKTTIRVTEVLPPLAIPGVTIDGSTQPGYNVNRSAINEVQLPVPVVAITPAEGYEVFRGLVVAADNVTIRGLSLYGFTSNHQNTASTPPADIFIAHRFPPPDTRKQPTPANFSPYYSDDRPPQGTVIESNWLGIPPSPEGSVRTTGVRSAFGVSVFNGIGTTIRRNWIADHEGSAIITSVNAEKTVVSQNVITGNGVAGMPDAIRLEGEVNQAQITGNIICGNDGSGIYLFKPSGAVQIRDNQIAYNGRRLRRAAVYLMGNNHEVRDNQISYQTGPGVVIAAYPDSQRTTILSNRFTDLEGLSIDAVTQNNVGVLAYQQGDGPNPPRNSFFRRLETGNAAINAPQFATQAFVALGIASTNLDQSAPVEVFGKADPGAQVEIYQVTGSQDGYSALAEPIALVETNTKGEFRATLDQVRVNDRISAIAFHPLYGTSEPAPSVQIRAVDGSQIERPQRQAPSSIPRCVTVAPPPVESQPPQPIILKVPRNVHFALDSASISPASAQILDRIATALLENPSLIIEIQGHTDPRASDAYNLNLGARRAQSVRNYLSRRGVANERMTIRSLGEQQRTTQGTSKLDYARDRRVEIEYKDARNLEIIFQEADLQVEP